MIAPAFDVAREEALLLGTAKKAPKVESTHIAVTHEGDDISLDGETSDPAGRVCELIPRDIYIEQILLTIRVRNAVGKVFFLSPQNEDNKTDVVGIGFENTDLDEANILDMACLLQRSIEIIQEVANRLSMAIDIEITPNGEESIVLGLYERHWENAPMRKFEVYFTTPDEPIPQPLSDVDDKANTPDILDLLLKGTISPR